MEVTTMLVRFEQYPVLSPSLRSFLDLESGLGRVFDNFLAPVLPGTVSSWPEIDVADEKKEYVVVAELPGVKKEDVKVSVHNGVLTISGERKSSAPPENSSWIRNERPTGKFSRSVELPEEVQANAVSAELSDGLLKVRLPKSEDAQPREIEIR
jgi:HSP20 family protein